VTCQFSVTDCQSVTFCSNCNFVASLKSVHEEFSVSVLVTCDGPHCYFSELIVNFLFYENDAVLFEDFLGRLVISVWSFIKLVTNYWKSLYSAGL
jgi:hypothetical protein